MASAVVLVVLLAMLAFGPFKSRPKSRSITTCKWLTTNSFGTKWPRLVRPGGGKGPVDRHNFYVSRDTWAMFHGFARPTGAVQVGIVGGDSSCVFWP